VLGRELGLATGGGNIVPGRVGEYGAQVLRALRAAAVEQFEE
jgi:hypothetical protein